MQFYKFALPLAFLGATIVSAAPVRNQVTDPQYSTQDRLGIPDHAISERLYGIAQMRPLNSKSLGFQKRLSWGKAAAGTAAAVLGCQDFLATSEGQTFVSKLSENDSAAQKREPLNEFESFEKRGGFWNGIKAGVKIWNLLDGNDNDNSRRDIEQNDLTELVTDLRLEYRDASVHADADLLGLLRSALEVKV